MKKRPPRHAADVGVPEPASIVLLFGTLIGWAAYGGLGDGYPCFCRRGRLHRIRARAQADVVVAEDFFTTSPPRQPARVAVSRIRTTGVARTGPPETGLDVGAER